MFTRKKPLTFILIALVSLLIGAIILYFTSQSTSGVPAEIRSKIDFSPLIVRDTEREIQISNYQIGQVENDTKTLSYTLTLPDKNSITVTQYVQPSQFVDLPEYKERFLSNVVNQYASVQTSNGVIYLGRAAKQNKKQLGVMLEKGLLLFFNPTQELPESTWRDIGNKLVIEA